MHVVHLVVVSGSSLVLYVGLDGLVVTTWFLSHNACCGRRLSVSHELSSVKMAEWIELRTGYPRLLLHCYEGIRGSKK